MSEPDACNSTLAPGIETQESAQFLPPLPLSHPVDAWRWPQKMLAMAAVDAVCTLARNRDPALLALPALTRERLATSGFAAEKMPEGACVWLLAAKNGGLR